MSHTLLPACICGSQEFVGEDVHAIPVAVCTRCGVRRQRLRMTEQELSDWYRDRYMRGVYYHSAEQDRAVANLRLDAYHIASRARLLDVGCGNGAFVEAARARDIDAWGQELAASSESEFIYVGKLRDVAFPTDDFDVVTLHDVLEHVVDPVAYLKEIRRVLRRPGKLIVDFPRFFHEAGAHHWKPVEHLWMFNEEQLVALIQSCGFHVTQTSHPIPSKVVVEAERTPEKRPSILTPAGIGDSYWVLTKLPGFLRQHGLGMPDVWVQDSGGPKRTQPYLRNIAMINAAGYKRLSDQSALFREAYVMNGRTVYPDVLGVDYFIAYNGVMRAGRSLEEVDPEFGCDWYPRMHVSKEARLMQERMAGPGRYIVTFWAEAGMYRAWLNQFSAEEIVRALRMLRDLLDCRIVIMGAPWDRGQIGKHIADNDESFLSLIGSTSFDQMLGLIRGATAVVGFPAGNTILGTVLGIPTVLLWNEYFVKNFWQYSCPPGSNYAAVDTKGLTAEALVSTVIGRIEQRAPKV